MTTSTTVDLQPDGTLTIQGQGGIQTTGYLQQVLARVLSKEFFDQRKQARFLSQQVTTFDRYVDFTNGSDAATGASPDLAWKTLAKVNTSGTAGQKIGLRRGEVWREAHVVPADNMLYGAYGEMFRAIPKIKASKDYTSATWVRIPSTSIYQATITAPGTPAGLAFLAEDTVLLPKPTAAAVTVGSYNITGTVFTIWLPDSSNPTGQQIEVTDLGSIGVTDQKIGTIFQDIAIKHHATYCVLKQPVAGSAGGRYSRCEIGPSMGPDGINYSNTVGLLIEDCNIHDVWGGVEYPSGQGNGLNGSGFYDTEIRYNTISRCYVGMVCQSTYKVLNVHHNLVIRSRVNGINITGGVAGWRPNILNNVVWHRPAAAAAAGHGIVSQTAVVGPVWRNNIVICDYTGVPTNVQLYALSPALGSLPGTDIDYNLGFLFGGSTCKYGQINGVFYSTLADWQAALVASGLVAGNEAHGLAVDPLFADITNGDFTLKPGSPAINAGAAIGYPGEISLNGAVDLGVYEVS